MFALRNGNGRCLQKSFIYKSIFFFFIVFN